MKSTKQHSTCHLLTDILINRKQNMLILLEFKFILCSKSCLP